MLIFSECLGNVHSFQSNLVQVVNEYLQAVVKCESVQTTQVQEILESLTFLLPVVPELVQPVVVFLSSLHNPFNEWLSQGDLTSWRTLYRLLPFVVDKIRGIWTWESLFDFLSCDNLKIRFYACKIVCSLLNKTENERCQMERLLGVDQSSVFQSTVLMDLQKEEGCYQETIRNARRDYLQRSIPSSLASMEEEQEESYSSQQYVNVCGFIIPCNSRPSSNMRANTSQTTERIDSFVLTETSKLNLQHVCLQMQDSTPILLQGASGCGKTRLFQHLAHLTNNDDYIELYLDDQTDAKTLIGNYVCTDVPGEFVFQPGTLTQAISQGTWIIIEDIDKIPFDIVSTLLPIIEKGELSIPSRGMTIPVHENFRLFGTSCHSCTANNSPINSFLSNHWHVVNVEGFTLLDLQTVIMNRYPLLREPIV